MCEIDTWTLIHLDTNILEDAKHMLSAMTNGKISTDVLAKERDETELNYRVWQEGVHDQNWFLLNRCLHTASARSERQDRAEKRIEEDNHLSLPSSLVIMFACA